MFTYVSNFYLRSTYGYQFYSNCIKTMYNETIRNRGLCSDRFYSRLSVYVQLLEL